MINKKNRRYHFKMADVSGRHLELLVKTNTALKCLEELQKKGISVDFSKEELTPKFFEVLLDQSEAQIFEAIETKYRQLLKILNVNLENCKKAIEKHENPIVESKLEVGLEKKDKQVAIWKRSLTPGNAAIILTVFASMFVAYLMYQHNERFKYFYEQCSFTRDFLQDLRAQAYNINITDIINDIKLARGDEDSSKYTSDGTLNDACLYDVKCWTELITKAALDLHQNLPEPFVETLAQAARKGDMHRFKTYLAVGVLSIGGFILKQIQPALKGSEYELLIPENRNRLPGWGLQWGPGTP